MKRLYKRLTAAGLVVITAGADVLRFVPPLIIGKEHVDEMAEKLDVVLEEM